MVRQYSPTVDKGVHTTVINNNALNALDHAPGVSMPLSRATGPLSPAPVNANALFAAKQDVGHQTFPKGATGIKGPMV